MRILSPFLEHLKEYVGVWAFFAIFCFGIWHHFMSRLWGIQCVSVCQRKLKLSTYLHTVSYNHILRFLNKRLQFVWVLASSGFYSITWGMISRSARYKVHFQKQPLLWGNFFPFRCDIFHFFKFILLGNSFMTSVFSYNQINKQPENLYVNYGGSFGYFT